MDEPDQWQEDERMYEFWTSLSRLIDENSAAPLPTRPNRMITGRQFVTFSETSARDLSAGLMSPTSFDLRLHL